MQTTNISKQSLKKHSNMHYPINSFFKDEKENYRRKNFQMWNQIQPEIQSIADQIITEMELVKLAIQEIRNKNPYGDLYEKRISDAIYAIFSVGKNRFQDWVDRCDKELAFEYSGELFCYETEQSKLTWISFSKFLDHDSLYSYFNACLLLYAMEIITMNDDTIEIIRYTYKNFTEFRTALQDKLLIMDNYYTFQHRWKGSEFYIKALFV